MSYAPSTAHLIATEIAPRNRVQILDGQSWNAFLNRMEFGHLVPQAEAHLRQSLSYYRARQKADRLGWAFGNAAAWRPRVLAAVEAVRAARIKAGV